MSDAERLAELLGRIAIGDRASFDSLYADMAPKLFGALLRLLKDRAEAEDALQETFARIWTRADRFAGSAAPAEAWMFAVTRNLAIDRLRARKAPHRELDAAHEVADEAPTPEGQAELAGERGRLKECLGRLEASKAEAVVGAYVEGYTYQELATRYGAPLNTMRTWLRRSLAKLRECLEE